MQFPVVKIILLSMKMRLEPATICSFEESDSFDLLGVEVVDQKVNIVVRYGGGCENHEFCLIWPEVITAIYPPNFSVTLHHKSNDDPCYALITETISFDPDESNLKLSKDAIDNMRITVVNGSDESQFVSNK